MKNSIDSITLRTRRYWYVDGLAEITVGLFFGILSGYFPLRARLADGSPDPVLINLGLLAAVVLLLGLLLRAQQVVKNHLTYPRTGYVAYPRKQRVPFWQRYGLAAIIGFIGVSLAVIISRSSAVQSWMPFLTGAIAGLIVLSLSYRFRIFRFVILAIALILVGAVVSFINPGESLAPVLSSIGEGICFFVSGAVTLIRYLLNTRSASES